jgi:hypothetical protein
MANCHVGYIEESAITLILANYKLVFNWGIPARLLVSTENYCWEQTEAPAPVIVFHRPSNASVLLGKCERGESHDENRFGLTVKRVDIDQADLMVPRLTDARLTMEEQAGFKPLPR